MNKTPTTIKNETRTEVFADMLEMFGNKYGSDNIYIIGDSEFAVKVKEIDGKPLYITVSPTVKDFCERSTRTRKIEAYDAIADAKKYARRKAEKAAEMEAKKKAKAEKIERDKKVREKKETT